MAFYGCTLLKEVVIPDAVTHIGSQAFFNSSAVITWGDAPQIERLGTRAFLGIANEALVIPDSVTVMEDAAVRDAYDLITVHIGKNVKKLLGHNFVMCNNLRTITYGGTVAEFNAIEKERGWNRSSVSEVQCTDGVVERFQPRSFSMALNSATVEPFLRVGSAVHRRRCGCRKLRLMTRHGGVPRAGIM